MADSLVAKGGLDQWDLARRFASEYLSEPHRGYGRGAMDVLDELGSLTGVTGWEGGEDRLVRDDPTGPASAQFGGRGSYGNGAAMRTHPVALHCAGTEDRAALEEVAKGQALLTHAHKGRDGTKLLRPNPGCNGRKLLTEFSREQTGTGGRSCRPMRSGSLSGEPRAPSLSRGSSSWCETSRRKRRRGRRKAPTAGKTTPDLLTARQWKSWSGASRTGMTSEKLVLCQSMDMKVFETFNQKRLFLFLACRAALELGNDVTALHSVPSAIYSALRARDEDDGGGGTEKHGGTFER